MNLKTGDWVEVRSREEILRTLDGRGARDNLPFMPEMLRFCGRRFRVQAVAHKTCDTVLNLGGRRMERTVHLEELRCDGAAHGGCQAACLLFWKHEWLKKVDGEGTATQPSSIAPAVTASENSLEKNTLAPDSTPEKPIYSCQATRLLDASKVLHWWDVRQYVRDVLNRNVTLSHAGRVLLLGALRALTSVGIGYRLTRALHARVHLALTGKPLCDGKGKVPDGEKTPACELDLRPGEWVRVRPYGEILDTLNSHSRNRGLWFDDEMSRYCGESHRVAGRIDRIINEKTGEMMRFRNPNIVLENLNCTGTYTRMRLLCPRRVVTYWREIWLERVEAGQGASGGSVAQTPAPERRVAGANSR